MYKDFLDVDLDKVEDTFRVNIIQMIAMAKFALPYMSKGDRCVNVYHSSCLKFDDFSIINTTSVVTFRGSGTMIDYAATKGAIVGFTRSLASHLVPKGIRVNAVA